MTEVIIAVLTTAGVIIPATYTFILQMQKRKALKAVTPQLKHHPLKVRLTELVTYLNTSYRLANKGRTLLSRDHLVWKLLTGIDILVALEQEVDECFNSCDVEDCNGCNKLCNMNLKALDDIVVAYNNFASSQAFNAEELRAIAVYLPKFNAWHNARVEKMKEVIRTVCSSEYFKGAGCNVRQAIILDNYIAEYSGAVKDAEDVMNKINGELTGVVYKGEVM